MADHAASPEEPVSQDGRPDFEIGLALAGAISAGAYTAGVIDFLMQALQEWEKARSGDAPTHRVRMRTIAGASAGAITGALGIVALKRGLRPVALSQQEEAAAQTSAGATPQRIRCVLPSLYETWVTRPRMVAAPGTEGKDLLGRDDLAPKTNPVRSLLNAALLDEIQEASLRGAGDVPPEDPSQPHLAASPGPFPILSATMHVFITVTNLRGIPFEVVFGRAQYGMLTHGDRFHYRIANVGATSGGSPWPVTEFISKDQALSLDANALLLAAGADPPCEWRSYGASAVASGAFPGGLAPRLIETPFAQYVKRQYPIPVERGEVQASFPASCDLKGAFRFLAVDGGVVNNNPFDFVEYALWNRGETRRTDTRADRAVIMVAPFPEPPTFLADDQPKAELGAVIKALIPTLMNQARFRSSELGRALDSNDRSRFLISPYRSLENGPAERYAIACGLLGGFGGFLDEAFRAHDYQLGRRNCQRFLASILSLPAGSEAMRAEDTSRQIASATRTDAYRTETTECMVIPLLGEAAREVGLPPWPRMSGRDFQVLMRRIGGRFAAIRGPLVAAQIAKPEIRGLAGLLAWVSGPRLTRLIEETILADLVRRDQIVGWDLPPAVLAAVKTVMRGRPDDRDRLILAHLPSAERDRVEEVLQARRHDAIRQFLALLPPAERDEAERATEERQPEVVHRILADLPPDARDQAIKANQAIEASRATDLRTLLASLPPDVLGWAEAALERTWLDDTRLILANLVRAGAEGQRLADIATATHLEPTVVAAVLKALTALPADRPHHVLSGSETYRLQMHAPVGARALPVIGRWIERFAPQSYRYP